MARRALLLSALLLLPLALAPTASACFSAVGVPCGRIYPLILLQLDDAQPLYNMTARGSMELSGTITYKFDMTNEGYTAATPNEPIDIRFEFPRKPDWAELAVEPEVVRVDVTNPTNVKPGAEATNPQATYEFTFPITIRVALVDQAILRDGYDYAKLLVFAKSSESGLYQSGYGIKELRVAPEGALHEADVAGTRDVFTASPLPALSLAPVERTFAGTTVALAPPASPAFWEPGEFVATVTPAPAGRMVLAVHDEEGALVASTAPVDAAAGEARLNVTLVKPGRHTATLTLLPEPGTMTPPVTYPLEFDVGALDAEGWLFPKAYVVAASETVPAPLLSSADPLAQFQRDIPFFVFDTAQSASATLQLKSGLPVELGRGGANLQFSIHDPEGNMLQAGSVDPTKPLWSLRVGSVPQDGWYVVRVKGVGSPVASAYDLHVEVNYAAQHQARNRADGLADLTGPLLSRAGVNLTLPVETLALWSPSDVTPALDGADRVAYSLTIHDANGTLAYASGVREGAASFSPPAPGVYRAFVFAEPMATGIPFSPLVRAFTFAVGAGTSTIVQTFAVEDGFEAPTSAQPTLLGYHALPALPGAGEPTVSGGEVVDVDGVRLLQVAAANPGPGAEVPVTLEMAYAAPQTLEGPGAAPSGDGKGLPVPGLALGLALVAVGAVAVAIALARR